MIGLETCAFGRRRPRGQTGAILLYSVGLAALLAGPAAAQITGQLAMQSQPGDYIGQGQNYLYDETNALFSAQAYDRTGDGLGDYVTVHVRTPNYSHWWYLTFGTNQLGANLVQGTYSGAQRAPFAGAGHPGLDIFGDGRGCNTLTGSFQVEEALFDYSGGSPRLVRFAASFEQHCEGMTPALTGTLQFVDDRDLTPPTTTLSLSGATGENGWYRGPVQAVLTATDTGGSGGVATTYYTVDAGATETYAAPFTVTPDGNHMLSFWSVDQSGNREPRRSQDIKIDATAPALTASVSMDVVRTGGTTVGVTTVSGQITDALSGLAPGGATYSVVDEYGAVEPSGTVAVQADESYSFTLTLEGPRSNDKDGRSYQITVRARDLAGHAGARTVPATVRAARASPGDRRQEPKCSPNPTQPAAEPMVGWRGLCYGHGRGDDDKDRFPSKFAR